MNKKKLNENSNLELAELLYRLHLRAKEAVDKHDYKDAERLSKMFSAVEAKLEKKGFDTEKFMMSKGVYKDWDVDASALQEDKYWMGSVSDKDDFQKPITDTFIDGKTKMGPWATMSPESFEKYGVGLGLGKGQKYQKQPDGKWKKIEEMKIKKSKLVEIIREEIRSVFNESKPHINELWKGKLRANYDNDYEQFISYDEMYGISQRLGFKSPEEAWSKNPKIQVGVNPEDLKVIEEVVGEPLFSVDNVEQVIEQLKNGIKAPYKYIYSSTLGGPENVSILLKLSLDPKDKWSQGIYHNSRYVILHFLRNGELELVSQQYTFKKKFRKTRVKSIDDAIAKINSFLNTSVDSVAKNRPYDLPEGIGRVFVTEKGLLFTTEHAMEKANDLVGTKALDMLPPEVYGMNWYADLAEWRKFNDMVVELKEFITSGNELEILNNAAQDINRDIFNGRGQYNAQNYQLVVRDKVDDILKQLDRQTEVIKQFKGFAAKADEAKQYYQLPDYNVAISFDNYKMTRGSIIQFLSFDGEYPKHERM